MSDAAEVATEIVADVAEEVAEQAIHVAEVSRGLSGRNLGFAFGGLIVGTGLGGALGYIFASRRLEAKYRQIADEEVEEMRQHYYEKSVALENKVDKPKLEALVEERGYSFPSTEPPMAVSPPSGVVEAAQDEEDVIESEAEPEVRNVFRDHRVNYEWDYNRELRGRSPIRPYVIHIDEREDQHAFESVTWTYYEDDDVVCNERDEVVSEEDRERVLGEANLERFGHGSNDPNVVYIRNNKLEMDVELVKSPNSYVEEVHGLQHSEVDTRMRRERIRYDDGSPG